MLLEEKVLEAIRIFGVRTSYVENMLYAIEQANNGDTNYEIHGNSVIKGKGLLCVQWNLEHVVGEVLLSGTYSSGYNYFQLVEHLEKLQSNTAEAEKQAEKQQDRIEPYQVLRFAHVQWYISPEYNKNLRLASVKFKDGDLVVGDNKGGKLDRNLNRLDGLKPVLRTFDSLTDDEIIEFVRMAYLHKAEYLREFVIEKKTSPKCLEIEFRNSKDCRRRVVLYDDFSVITDDFIPDCLAVYDFAIAKGFDVYGWIAKGLAISREDWLKSTPSV